MILKADIKTKKLILRASVFLMALVVFIINKDLIFIIGNHSFGFLKIYHLLWLLLMVEMLVVIFPKYNKYVSCGKLFTKHYKPINSYDEVTFRKIVRANNIRAIITLIFWVGLTALIGAVYLKGIISKTAIYIISLFFYFSDQFCINVWCPFKSFILKNKCCTSCRIYNWGHFMMFSPLVFIPSFFTLLLFFVSVLFNIQCDYSHRKYPERFTELTNANLKCVNCREKCTRN